MKVIKISRIATLLFLVIMLMNEGQTFTFGRNSIFLNASATSGFVDSKFVGGLNSPTAMDFSPDGRLFVDQKGGAVRVIKNGVLLPTPFVTVSTNTVGERGLLGITFDPNFSSNGFVYIYYTTSSTPIHNRVSRFTSDPANPDIALSASERVIIDLDNLSTATNHNAGAIHFGHDGKLYISTGENAFPANSQSLSTNLGKILRINSDGTIPNDNPFYNTAGAKKEIWALGLRNPFTFAISPNPSNNLMYINDDGQDSWEEINSGMSGANFGWPTCEGVCSNPNFINPIYTYPHNGSGKAIAGGAFYEADQFPAEFKGSYFFGDYVAGFIKQLTPDLQAVDFLSNLNTPVDIKIGPDGGLYYLSIGAGQVHRVLYVTEGNSNPIAVATANPTSGDPPLQVDFDGSYSTDPDPNTQLSYSWNFGDGSANQMGPMVSHLFENAGPYQVTLTVNDGSGGTDTDTINIMVGTPPIGSILNPPVNTHYSGGDTIFFSGTGTDEEDGVLPPNAFHWVVLLHHNTHTHPFLEFDGIKSGSFEIPTLGETSDDVWYRIYLTVTDSTGLQSLTIRDILPNKSTIILTGNVLGLVVNLDGQPHTTPYSFVGVVGIERNLDAPPTQNLGDQTYIFKSWSDGGDANHFISTPSVNSTYSTLYDCQIPSSGDWILSSNCSLTTNTVVPANVIVQNGAVLTIPNGTSLDIDFSNYKLLVKSGGGVLVKAGGKII